MNWKDISPTMAQSVMRAHKSANQSDWAFEKAIEQGKLSLDESADNWVGHYMYMFSKEFINCTTDHFKNKISREYDVIVLTEKKPPKKR